MPTRASPDDPPVPFFRAERAAGGADGVRTAGTPTVALGHRVGASDGIHAGWTWDGARLRVGTARCGVGPRSSGGRAGGFCVARAMARLLGGGAPAALDGEALAVFFRIGFFLGEDTPFAHIRALPPGAVLEWRAGGGETAHGGGSFTLSRRRALPLRTLDLPRTALRDGYIELFRQSIRRRPPPAADFVVPLSGGRDSRHILLELHAQGHRPAYCITARGLPPKGDEDVRIAALLAGALGVDHVVVGPPPLPLREERRKNRITSFCSDEHAWLMGVRDRLQPGVAALYDGIGGDTLSTAGLFVTPALLDVFRKEPPERIAHEFIARFGSCSEAALARMLAPGLASAASREAAVRRLAEELEQHLHAPNPINSFIFWNRTRREIALAPFAVLAPARTVFAPYLDHDLYDFLAALSVDVVLQGNLHDEAIRRAYPAHAALPYESAGAGAAAARQVPRGIDRELRAQIAGSLPARLMNNAFLLSRLGVGLLAPARIRWMAPLQTYLGQLETLGAFATPDRKENSIERTLSV